MELECVLEPVYKNGKGVYQQKWHPTKGAPIPVDNTISGECRKRILLLKDVARLSKRYAKQEKDYFLEESLSFNFHAECFIIKSPAGRRSFTVRQFKAFLILSKVDAAMDFQKIGVPLV